MGGGSAGRPARDGSECKHRKPDASFISQSFQGRDEHSGTKTESPFMTHRSIRVAPWPEDAGNPYQRLFYEALAPYGVTVATGLNMNEATLRAMAAKIDVIHLHWPEYSWRVQGDPLFAEVGLVAGLSRSLQLAHRLNLRIWWTAHNVRPHEGHRLVNFLGYRVVGAHADLTIAHSQFAAEAVQNKYRCRRVIVMPHGNFDCAYPNPRPREVVLRELDLDPRKPMVVCLGVVRKYKGIETGIDAVKRLGGRVQLLVAGDPKPDSGADQLKEHSTQWLRVRLHRLSDQEFSDFTGASDAVLLPYRHATTSGVLLAAWTSGRGVIASNIPCFADELAGDTLAGVLARPGQPIEFARAIESYLSIPVKDREAAALRLAARRDWSYCIRSVASMISAEQ